MLDQYDTLWRSPLSCSWPEPSREVWLSLEYRFSSLPRSHIFQLKTQLQSMKKGSLSITDHVQRIKHLFDRLAAVSDEDLIIYTLNGLAPEFGPFKTSKDLVQLQSLLNNHMSYYYVRSWILTIYSFLFLIFHLLLCWLLKMVISHALDQTIVMVVVKEVKMVTWEMVVVLLLRINPIYSSLILIHVVRFVIELVIQRLIAIMGWIIHFRGDSLQLNRQPCQHPSIKTMISHGMLILGQQTISLMSWPICLCIQVIQDEEQVAAGNGHHVTDNNHLVVTGEGLHGKEIFHPQLGSLWSLQAL